MEIKVELNKDYPEYINLTKENTEVQMRPSILFGGKSGEKEFNFLETCRETATRSRYLRNLNSAYYLLPGFRILNYLDNKKEANSICCNFLYNLDFHFFHEDMLEYLYMPKQNILYNLYIRKIRSTDSIYSSHCYKNQKSGMKLYELLKMNQVIDSWNLLCLRSFILAGIFCQVDKGHMDLYKEDKFKYMTKHFECFERSFSAIKYYDEHILGKERNYPYINNNFGILNFFNSINITI
jgi:hypothetical protein